MGTVVWFPVLGAVVAVLLALVVRRRTDMRSSEPPSMFIKDLLRRVHTELLESRTDRVSSGDPPIFAVEALTIEVHFVATRSGESAAGLDFKIVTLGGTSWTRRRQYQDQQVHKVVLSLTAADADELIDLEHNASRFLPREDDT